MVTKTKKNRQFYIDRAVKDFKTFVIYWNVTRPQHMKCYQKDGKFSLQTMLNQLKFLRNWENGKIDKAEKNIKAKHYSTYSKNANNTFDVDCRLVQKVLGTYRDEENHLHKISVKEIVSILIKDDFIKEYNAGSKLTNDKKHKHHWWHKKYLLKNDKYWFKLMNDPRYSDISKLPKASKRIKNIIIKWFQDLKEDDNNEVDEPSVETKQEVRPATLETLKWMYERGGLDKVYFILFARMIFKVQDNEINEYLSTVQMIDEPITNKHRVSLYKRLLHCEIDDDRVSNVLKNLYDREVSNI